MNSNIPARDHLEIITVKWPAVVETFGLFLAKSAPPPWIGNKVEQLNSEQAP